MKNIILSFALLTSLLLLSFDYTDSNTNKKPKSEMSELNDSVLRHVVLFKFKDNVSAAKIKEIEEAFSALPSKIPQIASYEWGLNNSPEGLEKGFTHCYLLTFKSEADRATYLPHPDHKLFGNLIKPHLEDVLVIDYWSQEE